MGVSDQLKFRKLKINARQSVEFIHWRFVIKLGRPVLKEHVEDQNLEVKFVTEMRK